MKTIEQYVEEFRYKTNCDNYPVGEYHKLDDKGESLLHTGWYPESPYEIDGDKVEAYLTSALNNQKKEMVQEEIGKWKKIFDYHSDMSNERHSAMRNVARVEIEYFEKLLINPSELK